MMPASFRASTTAVLQESLPQLSSDHLKIPHGKTVTFVGLSGAGKTTLLNLLTRFYTPTA